MNIIICGIYWRAAFSNLECNSRGGVYWRTAFIGVNTVIRYIANIALAIAGLLDLFYQAFHKANLLVFLAKKNL